CLLEKFQSLRGELLAQIRNAGHVSPWPPEIGDETRRHWIADLTHHNRDRPCRINRRPCPRSVDCDDDVDVFVHQLRRKPWQHLKSSTGVAHHEGQIPRLLIAQITKRLFVDHGCPLCSRRNQYTDPINLL